LQNAADAGWINSGTSGVTIGIIGKRRTRRRSDNSDVLRGGGGLGKASGIDGASLE